jgi:hypothetical protein
MKTLALALFALCISAAAAFAQGAPATVSFAARLQDSGLPLMGAHDFVFALYDAPTGGTQKYTQSNNGQMIGPDGLLYLDLGPFSATTHFTGPALYLEITIDGMVTTPRILVESVPYALRSGKAGDADGMGGLAAVGWQKAVTSTCSGATDSIKTINQDGTVTCYTGQLYTATTGGGLLLSSNMFSVDPTVYQTRIKGCATGAIASVAQDGTATCISVPSTAGSGISASALATGTITVDNTVQRALTSTCGPSGFLNTFSQAGAATCINASTGLTVASGNVTVDTTAIQARVTGTCSGSQTIQSINANGTVTCASGGASLGPGAGRVDTTQTTNNTGYTDLTTAGPSATVTIPASGKALVTVTGLINPPMNGTGFMSFAGGGITAADNQALIRDAGSSTSTGYIQASATFLVTGISTGSQTFTAKYKTDGTTVSFADRHIVVIPLP